MSAVALPAAPAALTHDEFLGHPKGVYVCFFTEMWERFSFYGMKALLLLYLLQHHKFGDKVGLDVLGAYGGLVYCLPVIGGMLADRYLGMRKAVVFGGLLLVLGHLGMTVEGNEATVVDGVVQRDVPALQVFYLSLALIIVGVGFLKPNISTIVGKLYAQDDPRRDSGFALFYAGINLGALFASIVCGYLGQTLGWSYGFGAAGIGMLFGLLQFLWGQKYLHGHAEPSRPEVLRQRVFGVPREWAIYGGAVLGLLPVAALMESVTLLRVPAIAVTCLILAVCAVLCFGCWSLWYALRTERSAVRPRATDLKPSLLVAFMAALALAWLCWRFEVIAYFQAEATLALALMILFLVAVGIWFVRFVVHQCSGVEGQQMFAVVSFIAMCLVFFTLYEQTYGSWVTFTDRMLTKDIVPALVQVQPKVEWTANWLSNVGLFARYAPWSILSLLLAPGAFMLAATLSDRNPRSRAPQGLFAFAVITMLIFLVRDCVVLPQTAGSLTYLGAIFLVLLAPIFSWIWGWLDTKGADPSKTVKSAWGLVIAGLSFLPLMWAAHLAGASGQMASVWWLVLAYFILEVGEMCLSPVGLAAVTQLSVPRVVSLMMGTWFLATAFSETLAALFGKLAALEIPEGTTLDFADAGAKYSHLFWVMLWIGVGCGIAAFLLAPLLKRLMHGVK